MDSKLDDDSNAPQAWGFVGRLNTHLHLRYPEYSGTQKYFMDVLNEDLLAQFETKHVADTVYRSKVKNQERETGQVEMRAPVQALEHEIMKATAYDVPMPSGIPGKAMTVRLWRFTDFGCEKDKDYNGKSKVQNAGEWLGRKGTFFYGLTSVANQIRAKQILATASVMLQDILLDL